MHDFSVFRTVSGPYDVQLLTHISAGYRASNAGYVAHGVRRLASTVTAAGSDRGKNLSGFRDVSLRDGCLAQDTP